MPISPTRCKLPDPRGRYMQHQCTLRKGYFMTAPLDQQIATLAKTGMTRFFRNMFDDFPDLLMKDVTVEEIGPNRTMRVRGSWVRNFGSDSFLGLDQHPRVKEAVERGVRAWGTHNGTSRAFSSVGPNVEAEERIAGWLGTEAALIYPSVTLANVGALPGLATRHDVIVADQYAHNSIDEGMRIAQAHGVRTAKFSHNDAADLERLLESLRPYRHAVVALDGVYSMSGHLPPLAEFQRDRPRERRLPLRRRRARHRRSRHARSRHRSRRAGQLRQRARGRFALEGRVVPGRFRRRFAGRDRRVEAALEPAHLRRAGAAAVPRRDLRGARRHRIVGVRPPASALDANVRRLVAGADRLGLVVLGGLVPIVSVLIGEEEATLRAGRFLFDRGYYVQSVVFPAVPHGAGVLRMQVNANHTPEAIEGLLGALGELSRAMALPGSDAAVVPFQHRSKSPAAIPA